MARHDVVDCDSHVGFEFVSGVDEDTDLQGNDSASSSRQLPNFRRVSVLLSSMVNQSENNAA